MLQKITKAPTRFYQLLLLNVGLIIGLCKEMSLIGLVASLVFIALAVAPIALYLGLLSPPPHQILQDEVCQKLKDCHNSIRDYISKWQLFQFEEKSKLIIKLLLAIYISFTFVCPCIQNFLIVNIVFAYFFMQEEVDTLKGYLCKCCSSKCQ